MFKLIGISLILAVIQISESAPVYQFLPPREGYVPVYIRLGDTPLNEINPDLALAFHESNIETRNVNDLDEQMQNDAPINDDLSESLEDTKDKVPIRKDSESDSEEKFESPEKKSSVVDNKSEEDNESEEEPASAKEGDSEESEEPSTTNKANSDDSSSEEATKSKRNITVQPPPPELTKEDSSSEEVEDKVVEKKASTTNESKSSEELENKS